ncbi:MAG: TetR/AcrR family transcriptional regulator [Salaquimonas sp.]
MKPTKSGSAAGYEMARPKPDIEQVRSDMLQMAEILLIESGGRRIILSDVAGRLGMSQSYAHRFFPTKHDLIAALAENWFSKVEAKGAEIVSSNSTPAEKLRAYVLGILEIKRDKFDENPQLFLAYLDMAKDHEPIVKKHVNHLTSQLKTILLDLVAAGKVDNAIQLVEDSTILFRAPQLIAANRSKATNKRAEQVIDMLLKTLSDARQ